MGLAKNQKQEARSSNGGRGSTNNKDRLAAFAGGRGEGGADWGGCNPDKLQSVVSAITALGGAVTFGLSRDQGAHSLTLMLDNSRKSLWYNGDADLDAELDAVLGTLSQLE